MGQTAPKNDSPTDALKQAVAAADAITPEIKKVDFDGYELTINTDLLDDIRIVDLIDRIETKKELKAIVEFLHYLIGRDEYEKMIKFFADRDGRFRLTQLSKLYYVIFEQFDPKD